MSFFIPALLIADQLPVETRVLWENNSILALAPVYYDSDSLEDLLMTEGKWYYTIVRNQNLNVISPSRQFEPGSIRLVKVWGVDAEHLWLTYVRHDSAFVCKLWGNHEIFVATGPKDPRANVWDGAVNPTALSDLDSDGRLNLLTVVNVGFAREPRGIFCFDWQSGNQLWNYLIGPYPSSLLLRDIDHDGRTEILFGSVAPYNGSSANGTSDSLAYVFCLNADGTLRWQKQLGRYPQNARIAWLQPQDTNDMRLFVGLTGCPLPDHCHDSLFILDARSGALIRTAQHGAINQHWTVFQNQKGECRIAIANSDDTLRILDENLRVRQRRALGGSVEHMIAGHFTGSKGEEIAVSSIDGQLLLYDEKLNLLAQDIAGGWLWPVCCAGYDRLVAGCRVAGNTFMRLYEFRVIPFWDRPVNRATAVIAPVLLALAFGITLLAIRYNQIRDIRVLIRGLTGQAGVIEIDRHGRVTRANARARELLGTPAGNIRSLPTTGPLAVLTESVRSLFSASAGGTAVEMPLTCSGGQTCLARCTRVKSGVIITLEDLSAAEYMRRAKAWMPVAQRLAHGIKTPLSTIRLVAQQIEEDGRREEGRIIQDEVERLSKMADGFMRLGNLEPPRLAPVDVNRLIRRIVEQFGLDLRPELEVRWNLASPLPLLLLDEDQFSKALGNLIDNAVAAMNNQGTLILTTRIAGREVIIEVSDTGPGIPAEYQAKLFQPFFTRKPGGTGLGLAIVKKIVEDHNGRVECESIPGTGTTFRIILPVRQAE